MLKIIVFTLASLFVAERMPQTEKSIAESIQKLGVNVEVESRGIVFIAPALQFEFGSYAVTHKSQVTIDAIVSIVNRNNIEHRILYFEGHTDSVGDEQSNHELGLLRAKVVRDAFIKAGLHPNRTLVVSYGETIPISLDPSGNRRVEVVLANTGEK